jgi:2-dehydropantoate 2-reductase
MTRYIIIGAGAVGGALAASLHQAGSDVVLVARGEALTAIADRGLVHTRPGGVATVPVTAVGGPDDVALTGDDTIVLAVKAQDAVATLQAWAWRPVAFADRTGTASELPIVTLQNGLETERAALRLFDTVVSGTTFLAGVHLRPGEVLTGAGPRIGQLILGGYPTGTAVPGRLVEDLRAAEWLVQVVGDVSRWKASKLVHNVTNGTELLSGTPERVAAIADRVAAEAREVLTAAGYGLADPATERDFDASLAAIVPGAGYEPGQQSTWQSFVRGRPSEVDYLNGEIALLARQYGVAAPYNAALQAVLGVSSAAGEAPGARSVGAGGPRGAARGAPPPPRDPGSVRPGGGGGMTAQDVRAETRVQAATRTWTGPEGIPARGTLVLVVGRGETPDVYERFGRRISSDAYVVVAVPDRAAAREALADAELPRPLLLAGSDSGALAAASLAAEAEEVAGVVLVGLPSASGASDGAAGRPADWQGELEARTACPNHRKVLTAATTSGLWDAVDVLPNLVVPAVGAEPGAGDAELPVPVLAIHGGADRVSPLETAREAYRALGVDELAVVDGGLHDALNDVTHRSVAATIVLFLERVKAAAAADPIVTTGRP